MSDKFDMQAFRRKLETSAEFRTEVRDMLADIETNVRLGLTSEQKAQRENALKTAWLPSQEDFARGGIGTIRDWYSKHLFADLPANDTDRNKILAIVDRQSIYPNILAPLDEQEIIARDYRNLGAKYARELYLRMLRYLGIDE